MTTTDAFMYAPHPSIFSYICSSVYETTPGNELVDFAIANGGQTLELQGLGGMQHLVFDLQSPRTNDCSVGWNALPILLNHLQS